MKYFLLNFVFSMLIVSSSYACTISVNDLNFGDLEKAVLSNEALIKVDVECEAGSSYKIVKSGSFFMPVAKDNGLSNGNQYLVLARQDNVIMNANDANTGISDVSTGTVKSYFIKAYVSNSESLQSVQKSGNIDYTNQLLKVVKNDTEEFVSNASRVTARIFGACTISSAGTLELGTITVENYARSIEETAQLFVQCEEGQAYKLYADKPSTANVWVNNTITPIPGVVISFDAKNSSEQTYLPVSNAQYLSAFGASTQTYDLRARFNIEAASTGTFNFQIMPTVVF